MDEPDFTRPMTAGLIVNPKSGKGKGRGLKLADRLKSSPDVAVATLHRFSDLQVVLADFAARGVTDLFISSGDGTIQAIQTALAERSPFTELPRLGLLPHGTTNMTAADIGIRTRNVARQAAFIASATARATSPVADRPTLRIANPADGRVRHGMFTGTGALWQGTKYCQDTVHRTGLKGDLATFATLAAGVAKALVLKPAPGDPTRIDRPHTMQVAAGDAEIASGDHLCFLATTLKRLIIASRPFWGGEDGPLRASLFPYPPPPGIKWMSRALYGGEDRHIPPGCHSFAASHIDIAVDCPFVVDGEFYDPPKDSALHIETGTTFTYLLGK